MKPEKFYKDPKFINHTDARPLRILSEYIGPKKQLEEGQVEDTIVFFGSARSVPLREARKELKTYQGKYKTPTSSQKKEIHRLEYKVKLARYYDDAVELAAKLTTWTKKTSKDKDQRYFICSGGGPGMMEAANKGAKKAKGKSVGLNISLPFESNSNPYITPELNMEFHYFFTRKYWFAYYAKALVVFPGGFGTLDELAEILTLIQTGKIKKAIPILVYGKEFWEDVMDFKALSKWGTISPKDLNLIHMSDDVDEAYEYLTKTLTKKYGV